MSQAIHINASASRWGCVGFIEGTSVAIGVTLMGQAPITAWVCTQCLYVGIVAGVAAFTLKAGAQLEQSTHHSASKIAQKVNLFWNTIMTGGVTLFGAVLSALNYHTFGTECQTVKRSHYCTAPQVFFFLTSAICIIATIATIYYAIQFLTLKFSR